MTARSGTTYLALIDDDESYICSLARLLRASHYHPVTYDSAEAFLADKKHPHFDCLLVDIQLGGISGLELSRRLTAVGSSTPIIYITAYDDPKAREEALATGCFALIRKTEPSTLLLETIAAALNIGDIKGAPSHET